MKSKRYFLDKYLFFGLLGSLIMVLIIAPFFEKNDIQLKILHILLISSLFFSASIVSKSKTSFKVVVIFGLPMLLLNIGALFLRISCFETYIFMISSTVLFFIVTTVLLLRKIFISKVVDTNILLGAISIYLLLAVIWGLLYNLVSHFAVNSFNVNIKGINDCMYFSLATLTTVGYGDITPSSTLARLLATMEAVTAQLYLTVIIARLVGLHMKDCGN